MRCFRELAADTDPSVLLEPGNQYSTPWGGPDHGPCDTCRGGGVTPFRCLSCLEEGPDPDCPVCEGRVEFEDRCATCAGTGSIADTTRQGVSAFPKMGGLLRYLVEKDFDFSDSVIVELEGRLSDEPDLDAERGAILVHPTEIVTRHAIDPERVEALRARLVAEGGPQA